MKYQLLTALSLLLTVQLTAQTHIATSTHSMATAYHNQRKIVRDTEDNIYIVFVSFDDYINTIKGVMYNKASGQWNEPFEILKGVNPTLAISYDDKIHLIYQTNAPLKRIKHLTTYDFINWTDHGFISDTNFISRLPVADIDSAGYLNVFWKQINSDTTESLVYANVLADTVKERKYITTKNTIYDIAVANHLQYLTNDIYFAIQYNVDTIELFWSTDRMQSFDTVYTTIGSQPCISYNSDFESFQDENWVRLMYLDENSMLNEVEAYEGNCSENSILSPYPVDYVCIDNLAPPIGYSYIFMQWGAVFHGFSYGVFWDWSTTLDSIYGSVICNPSVAYKKYNPEYVDFIYTEGCYGGYHEVYHKRDEKHIWVSADEDPEKGKGFSITGYPNPFTEKLLLDISMEEENAIPQVQIYDLTSKLVNTLSVERSAANEYHTQWSGTNTSGEKVKSGVYFIMCNVGDKRTARKVLYNGN